MCQSWTKESFDFHTSEWFIITSIHSFILLCYCIDFGKQVSKQLILVRIYLSFQGTNVQMSLSPHCSVAPRNIQRLEKKTPARPFDWRLASEDWAASWLYMDPRIPFGYCPLTLTIVRKMMCQQPGKKNDELTTIVRQLGSVFCGHFWWWRHNSINLLQSIARIHPRI